MSPFQRRTSGVLVMAAMLVLDAAFIIAAFVGALMIPDDVQNVPRILLLLFDTPWWVPGLVIPALLTAVAFWAFWPDRAAERAIRDLIASHEKAMADYKATNDKAWGFEAKFLAAMERMEQHDRDATERLERHEKALDEAVLKMEAAVLRFEQGRTELVRYVESAMDDLGQRTKWLGEEMKNDIGLFEQTSSNHMREEFDRAVGLLKEKIAQEMGQAPKEDPDA